MKTARHSFPTAPTRTNAKFLNTAKVLKQWSTKQHNTPGRLYYYTQGLATHEGKKCSSISYLCLGQHALLLQPLLLGPGASHLSSPRDRLVVLRLLVAL